MLRLVALTARWVHVDVFQALPVWYPEFHRGSLGFKHDWTEPQMNRSQSTGATSQWVESNTNANTALTCALGTSSKKRRNWSCCHIWGTPKAAGESNAVIRDPKFFSCTANMVLLPTPLKAFTDEIPSIKNALRICAFHYYRWFCDHPALGNWEYLNDNRRELPDGYPNKWPSWEHPNLIPPGVVDPSTRVWKAIERRKRRIGRDLREAGEHYPRDSVRNVLSYWEIEIEEPTGNKENTVE